MNDELLALQSRVNAVIYNPFINLKDQVKELKKLLGDAEEYKDQIARLDSAIASLDEFEALPPGNLERIKGFNKIKSHILKLIKDLQAA